MPRPPSTLLSLSQSQEDPIALANLSNSCSELESSSVVCCHMVTVDMVGILIEFFSFLCLQSHSNLDNIALEERTPRWLIYFAFTHHLLLKELRIGPVS